MSEKLLKKLIRCFRKERTFEVKLFKLPKEARFSNKQILVLLLPILFEQLMVASLGTADTFMVSSMGQTAVAGVALVNRIDGFIKSFLLAMAQGGTVVMSQYIGAENEDFSKVSLKTNIRIIIMIGLLLCIVMTVFKGMLIRLLFGNAEAEVIAVSDSYFAINAFSYPFLALYYACSASFRAMGESRIPFYGSVVMMLMNLVLKYIFIFKLDMGVKGAALSTLIAMVVVGFVLLAMMKNHKNKVKLEGLLKLDFDVKIASKILKISVPNGIEQAMFQLGVLAIAGLVSGLGEAAIAADSIARNIASLISSLGIAFNAVMMIIIGQCMGAGEPDEAEKYTKHILKLDYFMTFINAVLLMVFLNPLTSIFNVSPEAKTSAFWIMVTYILGTALFYPMSFAVASALRGTGDTKFVMVVSITSMFLIRIGAAYIYVYAFGCGVLGIWFAMISDWVIRSIVFIIRFKKEKWKLNKVI